MVKPPQFTVVRSGDQKTATSRADIRPLSAPYWAPLPPLPLNGLPFVVIRDRRKPKRFVVTMLRPHMIDFGRRYADARGKYRVFNDALYRFYWSNSAPPEEGDTPDETDASLPYTTTATFGDATWWLSVSLFNGVLDSGFLPIGINGETYVRIDISGGDATDGPPAGPVGWRLDHRSSGIIRVLGLYAQTGDLRADEWAIAYTTDGSTPATDDPDVTQTMDATGLDVLNYDLPAAEHASTVKVRLQTRRQDGETWVYSEDSVVKEITVDNLGPSAPTGGDRWPGTIGEDL